MAQKWVFESLVRDENDGVGLIAYALYKYKKYSLAKSLREEGKDEDFIAEQVRTFHDHTLQNNTLNDYRENAKRYLDLMFNEIEEDLNEQFVKEVTKIEKECNRKIKKEKTEFIKKVQNFQSANRSIPNRIAHWLLSGVPGIVSSFIITAIILGASMMLVPEDKRKDVFADLAIEYLGIENQVHTIQKP